MTDIAEPLASGRGEAGAAEAARRTDAADMPKSCTREWVNLAGLAGMFAACFAARAAGLDPFAVAMAALAGLSLPIIAVEALVYRHYANPSTGLDWTSRAPRDPRRVLVKLLGLAITLGLAVAYYWLFDVYRQEFYQGAWRLLEHLLIVCAAGAVPYFYVLDKYQREPLDGYWHVGSLALGRWRDVEMNVVRQHFLGWLVKVFFLALMFPYFLHNLRYLLDNTSRGVFASFQAFYDYGYNLLFLIDLVFVCVGYILTLRVLDTHIRTVEPTALGWMAALVCYDPFATQLNSIYLNYNNQFWWGDWLYDHPALYVAWGSVILILLGVYAYATVSFGLRFSNLTHRGVITNGPYRYCKHPAYLSKNLSWWMISIPFIAAPGQSWGDAVRLCLMLCGVNLIYYLRAKTEERHLQWDPVYRRYAEAVSRRRPWRRMIGARLGGGAR